MDIIELFHTLKQTTITKAQILQQLLQNKQKAYLIQQLIESSNKNIEQGADHTCNWKSQLGAYCGGSSCQLGNMKDGELVAVGYERLGEALGVLRRQEVLCRQYKNRIVNQRFQLLYKLKKQHQTLQLHTQPIPHPHNPIPQPHLPKNHPSTITPTQTNNQTSLPLTPQPNKHLTTKLTELEAVAMKKQHQLVDIRLKIEEQKEEIDRLYDGLKRLRESIAEVGLAVEGGKGVLSGLEFQGNRLRMMNGKLKKQMLIAKQQCGIRPLQQKVKFQKDLNHKLMKLCSTELQSRQSYIQMIKNVKEQLQD